MITPTFELTVDGVSLPLIEFDGVEAMNRLFEFDFTCSKPTPTSKLTEVIDGDAIFTIKQFDTDFYTGDLDIPGYISKASNKAGKWVLKFHPKIKKTSTNCRSEIHYKNDGTLTASQVIQDEIDNDIVIEDRSFVNSIGPNLPGRKLFCQYNESNFNFVARLCDHWGIQYYFDHDASNIVLSDMNSFDHFETGGFSEAFKTTVATADNNKFKLKNWSEAVKIPERFITVIGHDHQNAGTDIISSYPTGDNSGLSESRLNISGVQTQVEADYLAQIRFEAENCKNQLATATSSVPYLHPGFIVATDDSDFTSALVIHTVHRARNLDSHSVATGPSYECDIEMIPENSNFRPDLYYPIPQATTVLGHTITDATDSTLAQRNESGEYKVKFMGFESGAATSSEPWIRKAQTTGGSNSVDVPLTPNTEVLLAFVDNNLDCPYIQHAMDNSMHPIPVTNQNAHHAVFSTDGMLVTSALQGRYNLTTTRQEERVGDDAIGDSVKNYFTNRGDFDQNNNFIDPSGTNDVFTPDDRASGDYIINQSYGDQVQISKGDRLHWHNGNLYDFGGYWNYNLGNSYEENYLNQAAQLNQKTGAPSPPSDAVDLDGAAVAADVTHTDLLDVGGPNFSAVEWINIADKVDLATEDDDYTTTGDYPFPGGAPDITDRTQPFDYERMNTSKTFSANSYSLSSLCNEINVTDRVNTLDIVHKDGVKNVELTFKEGKIRQLAKSGNSASVEKKWTAAGDITYDMSSHYDKDAKKRVTKEKKWDIEGNHKVSDETTTEKVDSVVTDAKSYNFNTGALAAHNIKKTDGMGLAEMDFSFDATAKSNFNFGVATSFSLSAQREASIAISFSSSAKLNVGFSADIEIKTGAETGVDLDLRFGAKFQMDKDKVEFSTIGLSAGMEAAVKAKAEKVKMKTSQVQLEKLLVDICSEDVKIISKMMEISSGMELKT